MKRITFLWALLLFGSGVLFAKDAKTNETIIGRVDRSNWQAIAVSDERADDGGGMAALIDDRFDTFWHSQWGPDVQPPHWVVIDLGEGGAREFTSFDFYKRQTTTRSQKTIEIYTSNDPTTPADATETPGNLGWSLIGEGVYPDNGSLYMYNIETPGSKDNQGRYLLFYFPDSYDRFAMMAEIFGYGEIDYKGTPYQELTIPGIIEAEYYDKGGEGVAYHDRTPGRVISPDYDNSFRNDDEDGGVDVLSGPDDSYHIDSIQNGEYVNYTVNVAKTSYYDAIFYFAGGGANFHVLLDGKPFKSADGYLAGVGTASNDRYAETIVDSVYITEGKHLLTLYLGASFDKVQFIESYAGVPYGETAAEVPGVIEAEDFDKGGEGIAYHSVDPTATNTYRPDDHISIVDGPEAGGYQVATKSGEWLKYTLTVTDSKNTRLVPVFYGKKTTADNFTLLINGKIIKDVTDFVPFPSAYEDPVELEPIDFRFGKNTIEIQSKGGNFDKIEFLAGFYEGRPFKGEPSVVTLAGATVEAEDFDIGGEGISFHRSRTDVGDVSRQYRGEAGDGSEIVSLESRLDGALIDIGNFTDGDWTAYTIDVQEAGSYDIYLVTATDNTDRKNRIQINDDSYEVVSHTPNWAAFEYFGAKNVNLKTGVQTLYVYINSNFDKIVFKPHADETQPYQGVVQEIPGTLYAWKFDEGGLGFGYEVTNKTKGLENNSIRTDEYVPVRGTEEEGYYVDVAESYTPSALYFTVNVKEEGYYNLTFLVGCDTGNETFSISGPGSASVTLPNAVGEWRDLPASLIYLEGGVSVLKVRSSGRFIQLKSIKFELVEELPLDRSEWVVLEVSDEKESDGGGKNTLIDGNVTTYWHSNYPVADFPDGALPHWAIIDMAYPTELSKITTYRRTNGDTKTVQYSVGNDPNPDSESWTLVAEGEYDDSSIHSLELPTTQTIKARYLKLFLPDSNREPFIGVAEIYGYGKVYAGIKSVETLPGKVYIEKNILKVKGFSATASLFVYNLLGQKVTTYKTLNGDVAISLPSNGIFIVKVQDKGLTNSYKVIAK
jgi:hypothetical protein